MQITNCYTADVNASASGDTALVTAVDVNSPIKVWKMVLDASGGANTVIFKAGATALTPTAGLNMLANQTYTQAADGVPLMVVPPNIALNINLSAATLVKGTVYYTLG